MGEAARRSGGWCLDGRSRLEVVVRLSVGAGGAGGRMVAAVGVVVWSWWVGLLSCVEAGVLRGTAPGCAVRWLVSWGRVCVGQLAGSFWLVQVRMI